MIVEKAKEGYLVVSADVYEAGETWLYHEQFLYYTKREAIRLFKEHVRSKGWVIKK
jgi:hypothetical protein